ncbi:MAG: hypothetical protein CTY39_01405 [Hyphomicrobium sp.]|nr:MAG: hypothetical protein CTY39_01405 [Hyphomicrobium sp.]
MKPHSLLLQGFTGISSGSGKEEIFLDLTTVPKDARLVALVGPNGAGKSTIMDNLHPYRVMPSRSSTLGPTGFSYWDNINKQVAKKDFIWEHGGRKFRSALSFKVSGKTKKADCYLFVWNDALRDWTPYKAMDGTLSDGKTDTYDRCVEDILGTPESFFTSHFSAQNRKSLSSYGASEIKSLLASILDLSHYREMAAKAAMVGKLLRFQLDSLQEEISQSRNADAAIAEVDAQIADLEEQAIVCAQGEKTAAEVLDQCRKALSILEAKRDSQAKDDEESRFLNGQIARARESANTHMAQATQQAKEQTAWLVQEETAAQMDLKKTSEAIAKIDAEINRLNQVTAKRDAINAAAANLPIQREKVQSLDAQILAEQAKLANVQAVQLELQQNMRKQGELQNSGQSKAETIQDMTKTASLIDQVPCQGSAMQRTCPLLAKANEAKEGLPQQEQILLDMRGQYRSVNKLITELQAKVTVFNAVESEIKKLDTERKAAAGSIEVLSKVAALIPMLEEADLRLPQLAEEKAQLHQTAIKLTESIAQCTTKIAEIAQKEKTAIEAIQKQLNDELKDLNERLERLEKPVSENEIAVAKQNVQNALAGVDAARAETQALAHRKVMLAAQIEAFKGIKAKVEATVAEAERLSEEIAKWKLLEKGMGNDGLIALSIDDAGPEISMLCNSLLEDCYDGRFVVRLDTQRETQTGNLKETFDVIVHDTHRGEEKSLGKMSGGERVWVNECLTRAIALYVGQSNAVQFHTLFSDESDGPLDPDRKRQFMKMKRSVLERGGYEREYFISQTEELWSLADHIINVAAL